LFVGGREFGTLNSPFPDYYWVFFFNYSAGLIVDDPKFLKRLMSSLIPRVKVRFVIVLWGNELHKNENVAMTNIPLYKYSEITELGEKRRHLLVESSKEGIISSLAFYSSFINTFEIHES
jgi:hypothetical protein